MNVHVQRAVQTAVHFTGKYSGREMKRGERGDEMGRSGWEGERR